MHESTFTKYSQNYGKFGYFLCEISVFTIRNILTDKSRLFLTGKWTDLLHFDQLMQSDEAYCIIWLNVGPLGLKKDVCLPFSD